MKNYFSKKVMVLAFAFGGLFMIGNNVFAEGETTPIILDPVTVTCSQYPGYNAQCWTWYPSIKKCEFNGNPYRFCFY